MSNPVLKNPEIIEDTTALALLPNGVATAEQPIGGWTQRKGKDGKTHFVKMYEDRTPYLASHPTEILYAQDIGIGGSPITFRLHPRSSPKYLTPVWDKSDEAWSVENNNFFYKAFFKPKKIRWSLASRLLGKF